MLYLTLRHYEYVCAIGREGSLSAAATQLNVSQPALSVALTRIEEHLGHALFIRRRGANLVTTPQGRDFIDRAEAMLAQAAQLEDPTHPHPATTHLTLGCFVDLAPFLLAPALRALHQFLPHVTVSVRAEGFESLIEGLLKGQIDIALTFDLGLDAGFGRETLYIAQPVALMAPDHTLAGRTGVSLSDLAEHNLILSDEGLSAQHMLTLFRRKGLRPHVAHRTATLEILRSLSAHGAGIGISYTAPKTRQSYDGSPLAMVPIVDADAGENVILTRHGTGPTNPTVAQAQAIIAQSVRDAKTLTSPLNA